MRPVSTTRPNTTNQTAASRWRLDAADSSAEFRVPHLWGLVTVRGHFERFDGSLEIDQRGRRRLELTIDAASLNTGNGKRDVHLRSAAFFDAERHPDVRFRSTSVSDAGDGRLRVAGDLEAAGNRVRVELSLTLRQADDELQLDTSTTIDQRQLGMTWSPLGMARTPTTVVIVAHLRREQ